MRFSQADSTSNHARTPWCCQPEKKSLDIVILSFCNIVKGQANCFGDLSKFEPFIPITLIITYHKEWPSHCLFCKEKTIFIIYYIYDPTINHSNTEYFPKYRKKLLGRQ